ncbi:hypothetical protein PHSC3_001990 [Chlamydiales bacterium STE3]|nr:hypothetical protein PHSC3_001990 [Chlamydiales bacterium STE3]
MEIYDRVLTNIDYAEKSPLMKSIDKLHSRTVYSFLKGRKITREDGEVKTTVYPFRKLSVLITLIALPVLLVTFLIKALNKNEKRVYQELTRVSKKENSLVEGKVKENNPNVNPLNLSGVKKDSKNKEERDSGEETPSLIRRRTPRKEEKSKEGSSSAQLTAVPRISSNDLIAFGCSENPYPVPLPEEDSAKKLPNGNRVEELGISFYETNESPESSIYTEKN